MRRGAVLLLVLWLLILLGLVVLGLNRGSLLLAGEAGAAVGQVQARWAARAGVEAALELLHLDITPEDGPLDAWWDDPETFEAVELADGFSFTVQTPGLTEGTVRFGPADLGGRLPINAATLAELAALPTPSEDNAAALIDWRDGNEDVSPGGAERSAYDGLELPHDIRNGPFRTVAEMRLVEGVDGFVYAGDPATGLEGLASLATPFSYDPDTAPTGEAKLQLDNLDAQTLRDRYNFSAGLAEAVVDEDDVETVFDLVGLRGDGRAERDEINSIDFQWAADRVEDFVSADAGGNGNGNGSGGRGGRGGGGGGGNAEDPDGGGGGGGERGPGRVNINTAPRAVLEAMLGEDDAAEVEAGRVAGFVSLGELVRQGLLEEDAFEAVAPRLTVRSRVFEITSQGVAPGGRAATLRVVVDRGASAERPQIRWRASD